MFKYASIALASFGAASALTAQQLTQVDQNAAAVNTFIKKTSDYSSCSDDDCQSGDCSRWQFADGTSANLGSSCDMVAALSDAHSQVFDTIVATGDSCDCNSDDNCAWWTYNSQGGFMDVDACDVMGAFQEARDHEVRLNEEAASDDIGQLIIQLENVLEIREATEHLTRSGGVNACAAMSSSDVASRCADEGGDYKDNENDCDCTCMEGYEVCHESMNDELTIIKRFKNLKAMVMSMQPVNVTVFGRYCYYGCWCLPNGQHNLAAGYGTPVDPIDEICKDFALCYKCIDLDFAGACDPEKKAYRWGTIKNSLSVVIDIICKDDHTIGPNHRCKRYACECDRILAVGLGHTHWYWNVSHHARWGGFDRSANCETDCTTCFPQDDCCGAYGSASSDLSYALSRRPYASTNPTSGCCQDVFYYSTTNQECCVATDGTVTVETLGDCSSPSIVVAADEIDDFDASFPGYSKK